jgi:hypothetical protein
MLEYDSAGNFRVNTHTDARGWRGRLNVGPVLVLNKEEDEEEEEEMEEEEEEE